MKIFALSDLHGYLPELPKAILYKSDVVVIAGDIAPDYPRVGHTQSSWFNGPFWDWCVQEVPAHIPIIGTFGNHDKHDIHVHQDHPCKILVDESTEIDGVKFHGTPWVPKFGTWSWMKPDAELDFNYSKIPDGVDVVISHGPPHGWLDLSVDGKKCGSRKLKEHLIRAKAKVVICGHIHEARGFYRNSEDHGIRVYNVASVDERYQLRVGKFWTAIDLEDL